MARYQVTSPDGQKYEITAPDNATQEQVMGYALQQFGSAKPGNVGAALSGLNKGAAAILDSIADIGPNAMNLAKAAVGFPLAAAGRVDLAEKIGATDMLVPVSPARRTMEFAGAGQVTPANATQRRIDYVAQALPSVMLSPGVGLAKNAVLTGISGLATGEAQEQTGSTVGALMAGMLAPMGAQAV